MINIDRQELLAELIEFSRNGSGLVVGNPGVGKSHLLRQLKEHYLNNNIVCFLLKIDNLSEASDEAIQNELGLPEPWIETFKQINVTDSEKALLIFDTFDAARNEEFRRNILAQIRKAKMELAAKWNIVVSVRTYDAQKSQQLIQLFPYSEGHTDLDYCRKCTIPVLTDEEVQHSLAGDKKFENFYTSANAAMKEVLRIPFFLTLADVILHDAKEAEIEELKQFKSEAQLLKRYWDVKVRATTNAAAIEYILIQLTEMLVKKRALSVAKKEFLPLLVDPGSPNFTYLLQEAILDEVSVGGSRIAFKHNILFDYAVSILYITADIEEVIQFIQEDNSRPFFLRPSFLYFFTQLWYEERPLFWKFYWKFYDQEDRVFQLFVRLILTGVVASEFMDINDLQPVTSAAPASRKEVIRNILQSMRFIRQSTSPQDVQLLLLLSASLDILFLWEFSFLLERGIKDENILEADGPSCGMAARNFLSYILQLPDSPHKPTIDRLGASRGVELVCLTYDTDINASKALLHSLFALLKTSNFEIYYFTNLAQYTKNILPHDPSFVAEIYRTLYAHEENSDAETVMGGSVIMNFRSNRRQDFESTYYYLTELYPAFLTKAAELAVPIGMEIVNTYVIKDRQRYGAALTPQAFTFKSFQCQYIFDHASLWSTGMHYHKPAQLLDLIISHLKKHLQDNKLQTLKQLLDLYIQHAAVGYTWKTVIEFGTSSLPLLADYFYSFCLEPLFYTNSDTSFEVRELIEKGSPYFSVEQIKMIEEVIFKVANDYEENERIEKFAQRYLSRIPSDKLQLAASRELLAKKGAVENERPITFSSYSGIVTTEEWLQESGVDTSLPLVKEFLEAQEKLTPFMSRWLNGIPDRKDFESSLKIAYQSFQRIKTASTEIDKKVVAGTLLDIAQTFAYSCRNIDALTEEEFEQAKEVILYCFQYISEGDTYQEERESASGAYSPTSRIAASEALSYIAGRAKTSDWAQLVAEAVCDKNAIVRLNASRHLVSLREVDPDLYWSLIQERLPVENDAMVASTILTNTWLEKDDKAKANEVLNLCWSNEKLFTWQNSFMEDFILLAIKLWIHRQNQRADQILSQAWERDIFQRDVVFETFKEMRIVSLGDKDLRDIYMKNIIRWTTIYLQKAGEKLKALGETEFSNENPNVKSALQLIDEVIQRSYFVLERHGKHDRHFFEIPEDNRKGLYQDIKPLFEKIISISTDILQGGLIIGHTAHYFIQTLNACLEFDPKDILAMVAKITELSRSTGYTFDSMAIREVVSLTERLLADHRDLLTKQDSFDHLIFLLDTYMQSGWNDALELLWKLDEIFK